MSRVYLIDGVRTPIGKTNGILKDFLPEHLAGAVLKDVLLHNNLLPEAIDNVLLGNVIGTGGNIARLAVLEAGFPYSVPATTIDAQCGSGLSSLNFAHALIASGQADMVLAGGLESTSLTPKRKFNQFDPRYQGDDVYYEQAPFSPEWIGNPDIGVAAEMLAQKLCISREAMDEQALSSHQKAVAAREKGYLQDIIKPLEQNGKIIAQDECVKVNMSRKLLARLKPAFVQEGRITAGNSCLKHDGAAVVLLASENALKKYSLQAKAVIYPGVSMGCDPNYFPLAPVAAIKKLLQVQGLTLQQIDAIEINEAFAVKIIACCQQLEMDTEVVNRLGGAIAYGHPYGASGAIILLHLLRTLEVFAGRFGVASIGAVGGLGTATLIERL